MTMVLITNLEYRGVLKGLKLCKKQYQGLKIDKQ